MSIHKKNQQPEANHAKGQMLTMQGANIYCEYTFNTTLPVRFPQNANERIHYVVVQVLRLLRQLS